MLRFVRSLILCSLVSASVFACGGSSGPAQIAFQSARDGDFEIFVMDADGTNVRQLTTNDVWDGDPVWSPDGKQIAFKSSRYGDDPLSDFEIFVMDADGSNVVSTTQEGSEPSFKP